jgi:coniferyl-aldehyde dehydrogenase
MNIAPNVSGSELDISTEMQRVLDAQKKAHTKEGPLSAERRIEWLDRAINLLVGHKDAIA